MEKELLHRFFDGRASVEEEKQVLDWIDRDPANRRELLAERRLFDSMLMLADPGRTTRKPKVLTLPRWTREVLKYAAVILVIAGAGGIYVSRMYDKFLLTGNTITVPAGQHIDVQLPDGTKVWLNASSRLTYPETFDRRERRVTLEGEAYFEVAKNKDKRFIVCCNDLEIEALGTTFDVKGYGDDLSVTTLLAEGSVRVSNKANTTLLKPGEKVEYHKNKQTFTKSPISDLREIDFWRNNMLIFNSSSLAEIATTLERMYGVKVVFDSEKLKNVLFSGTIRNSSLHNVFYIISLTYPLTYKLEGDTVKIGSSIN